MYEGEVKGHQEHMVKANDSLSTRGRYREG